MESKSEMVEEGKTEGGIEQSRIIGDIEPYLLCNKCTKLAWKPKMCAGCNTLFCTSCYDPWAATQSTPQLCPKCDVQGKIKSAHAVYFRDMRKLQYKCHNYERCKETIKYDIFYTHKCPYDQIPCSGPNCKEEIFRKDVEQHEEKCSYIVEEEREAAEEHQGRDGGQIRAGLCLPAFQHPVSLWV